MTLQTFRRDQVGRKYHVEAPTKKHVENSLHGSRYANNHGYKTTDLDILPDERLVELVVHGGLTDPSQVAGHVWNTHWPHPIKRDGFHDPKHILGSNAEMDEMLPFEIERLVARHFVHGKFRTFRIPPIEEQFDLCGDLHLQVLLNPKRSPVFKNQIVWNYLASAASRYSCRTAVYSEQEDHLPFARRAGFNAWLIN